MTLEELFALGVTSCGGGLDFKNQNIGYLTKDGPVITPKGLELLEHGRVAPRKKPGRKPAAEVSDATILE